MKSIFSLFFALITLCLSAQPAVDLEAFLGYKIGDHFTYHHQVVDYFQAVAEKSDQVVFQEYGQSWERRPLVVGIISSPENIKNLETIRRNNLIRAGKMEGEISGKEATIVFLTYDIHGDEAACTEAALWTLERLTSNDPQINKWLEEVVVVIDPCLNPDGRERYATWFNQVANRPFNPSTSTVEHRPPWPGGRVNHYLFDLNRDW
ncbi:MAG: M14 family zinc carboxypeptidase, partial [Bacteroidota bacterium]